MFEQVRTVEDIWDRVPITGIADISGVPHTYERVFSEQDDNWTDIFLLVPIDQDTLDLAIEQWRWWRQWESEFHRGLVPLESHPRTSGIPSRYAELDALVRDRLAKRSKDGVRARGRFRTRDDSSWDGLGHKP